MSFDSHLGLDELAALHCFVPLLSPLLLSPPPTFRRLDRFTCSLSSRPPPRHTPNTPSALRGGLSPNLILLPGQDNLLKKKTGKYFNELNLSTSQWTSCSFSLLRFYLVLTCVGLLDHLFLLRLPSSESGNLLNPAADICFPRHVFACHSLPACSTRIYTLSNYCALNHCMVKSNFR